MKIVHSPDMVAHLWANKGQDNARNAGHNFYFTGPALYSYGSHYVIGAHLENGRILWNDAGYSNSTARHTTHAWRALSRSQADNRLHVPTLNYDQFRNLQRLHDSGNGQTLPDLAQVIADRIVSAVESMVKMRESAETIKKVFARCKALEKSAAELCAYVAKGKKTPKWPLSALPDEMPQGEALRALIKNIAKGKLITSHDGAISTAKIHLQQVTDIVEEWTDCGWRIQNLPGTISTIGRLMNDAQKWHVSAHGRKSAKVSAILKELAKIEPRAVELFSVCEAKQARAEIRATSRDLFTMLHQRGTRSTAVRSGYRSRRHSGYYFSKLRDAVRRLPELEAATHADILARASRCNAWDIAANGLESARDSMKTADSCRLQHPGDAIRHYIQASNYAWDSDTRHHPAFARVHSVELDNIYRDAVSRVATLRAEIAAKHARAVEDWKAGTISRLPFEAGTFARIKGETVETSRGAIVPVSHACRLARIARRVIAAGGKVWADGAGPMVGSFRVHSIGADGAATIGCHEFDGAESLRVLTLLESCEHCATVTANEEGVEA